MGHRRHRAGFGHGGHRCHRDRDRPADHREGLPRLVGHAAVGGHRLHPDPGLAPPARRLARRPVRAQAGLRDRRGLVRPLLGGVCRGHRLHPAHRPPGPAGRRRCTADPGQPGHPGGLVRTGRPERGHRGLVRARRRGHGGGPPRRWVPDQRGLVALDLPHQPARGDPGAAGVGPSRARVAQPDGRRLRRRPRCRPGHRGPGRTGLRPHRRAGPRVDVSPGAGGTGHRPGRHRRLRRCASARRPAPCCPSDCSAPDSSP